MSIKPIETERQAWERQQYLLPHFRMYRPAYTPEAVRKRWRLAVRLARERR